MMVYSLLMTLSHAQWMGGRLLDYWEYPGVCYQTEHGQPLPPPIPESLAYWKPTIRELRRRHLEELAEADAAEVARRTGNAPPSRPGG